MTEARRTHAHAGRRGRAARSRHRLRTCGKSDPLPAAYWSAMGTKIALAVLIALAVAAAATASPPTHAKVMLRSTSLGTVLVDARGRTLYLFERTPRAKSACYGQCAAVWPPFLTTGAPSSAGRRRRRCSRRAKRKDGTLQVVYAGHPLYFFSGDTRSRPDEGRGHRRTSAAAGTPSAPAASAVKPAATPPPARRTRENATATIGRAT